MLFVVLLNLRQGLIVLKSSFLSSIWQFVGHGVHVKMFVWGPVGVMAYPWGWWALCWGELATMRLTYDKRWYYTFIVQFGGRHEDLSHPENSCRPRAKPEGDINFLGGTNLRVSRLTGQLIVYYTESWNTTFYSAEQCAVRHDRETRRLEGNTTICSPSTWLP